MNVTLRQLRAFEAVARASSFTEAAASLHVTQSALSGLIRELEDALGVRVLNRTSRRVEVSEVGALFLPLTSRVLQDLDQALSAVHDLKALRTGVVRIAAPHLMACTLLPPAMGDFARRHPAVELHLSDGTAESVIAKLRSGEVDVAIGPQREPGADVEARPLFELPFVAALPATHPLASRRWITWDELAAQPLIAVGGDYTRMLNATLAAAGRTAMLRPRMEVAHMTTAISLVSAGLGITTCQPYAYPLLRMYGLRARPLGEPSVARRFDLFVRKDRELSPAAEAFAAIVMAHAAKSRGRASQE